ncbi:hypothetical protein E2C01_051933 [Portunus trituberculatus]|uniref:Uncharacterized protein n=1 Tax=Portunus trituberculatus TaxID=210409 RepID=A0A5B7GD38_PORTR|nr:hypothetical protein [Portunus trituberculatus]
MGGPSAGEDEHHYKIQTVSQSREGAQGTSAIARIHLGHTMFSAHLQCLHLSRDPFCPWCRTTPEAMEHFLLQCPRYHSTYCTTLSALCPGHHNTRPAYPPGGLRRPPLLATCCPLPYLCLLEEDWPATTPVIPTQDYPRAHKDPRGHEDLWILMSPGVVLCGYHRHDSWLVFLKKAQIRRRTAGCQEGWMPEAARRVGGHVQCYDGQGGEPGV